jgi:hypothetical protein
LNAQSITAIIAVIAAISGIILGWSGRSRTIRQDTVSEASKGAALHADVEYIKRGVDDLRLEQRAQGQRFDILAERVTRVEESAKQAHHRLNRLDGQKE